MVATDRTFQVAGHHYAIVVVDGLEPGSSTPYEIAPRWRPASGRCPSSPFPPSRIRTLRPRRARSACCSARAASRARTGRHAAIDPDVLSAYAMRMASQAHEEWPDIVVMLGDQVYADDTVAGRCGRLIRSRRNIRRPPHDEVADYEEYTALYDEAWGDPRSAGSCPTCRAR